LREVPFQKIWDESEQAKKCGFVVDRDYNAAMNILKSRPGRPVEPAVPMTTKEVVGLRKLLYSMKSLQKRLSQGKSFQ